MKNFLTQIIEEDIKKNNYQVYTRFPPEPNGYLHIGHCIAIYINFQIAFEYGGKCNLRFDDTNPQKEDIEYVNSIKEDIKWLGFEWEKECYSSDYFQILFDFACEMIKKGLAYVDFQSYEEISNQRGDLKNPGLNSPYRDTSTEENLRHFYDMKDGKYEDGHAVLRAKIDMTSPNINFRDPIIYRVKNYIHDKTSNNWVIYPTYDWAHGQSDYIEGITHSICTLEFEIHRPLYEWFLDKLDTKHYHPRQMEFSRLNLTYTLMSKRKLLKLVEDKIVDGWDDPRMPTIASLRRRGYTPKGLLNFISSIDINKNESCIELEMLEHFVREDLNLLAKRTMVIFEPVLLTITNYELDFEELNFGQEPNSPKDTKIRFSKNIYVERQDYMEDPPSKWNRLTLGKEVRLKDAYYITVKDVKKDKDGNILQIFAEYDKSSKGGWSDDGRKVKGTIHWIDCKSTQKAYVHKYDRLFNTSRPDLSKKELHELINPQSFEKIEVLLNKDMNTDFGINWQFLRKGYYIRDTKYKDELIFNETVGLKEGFKIKK